MVTLPALDLAFSFRCLDKYEAAQEVEERILPSLENVLDGTG